MFDREGVDGIDIGFAFLPEYEGNGYAFEANFEIMQHAKNDLKIKTINAITAKDNIASQKLLEKLGLHFLNVIILPNNSEEVLLYKTK